MAFFPMAYVLKFSMWPFFHVFFHVVVFHAANIPVAFFPMANKLETQVDRLPI